MVKWILKTGCEGVDWTHLDPDRVQLGVDDRSEERDKAVSGCIKV
jgi:hypothetical protein